MYLPCVLHINGSIRLEWQDIAYSLYSAPFEVNHSICLQLNTFLSYMKYNKFVSIRYPSLNILDHFITA